jgi:membrane associated rhomboid family serine protease
VAWIIGINTAVYLLTLVLGLTFPRTISLLLRYLALTPAHVMRGEVWQLVTYSFLHAGFFHWFGNMLGIWMFGSTLERNWGTKRFLELFGVGVFGAAATTVLLSYTGLLGNPEIPTVGASGGDFAILAAFAMAFGETEIFLFPFPALVKAKYVVLILTVVTVMLALSGGGQVAYVAHLGGLLFGYLYVRLVVRRSSGSYLSERYYGLRNAWHRWKRKQATKKFQVYMRQHDQPMRFDEHGNYVPPDKDKPNGSGSKWVN